MQRIGFVGIGLMGRQMGRRLMMAGFPLQIWNRTKEKAGELLTAGATW
jgi:3-hydroxyisobutyrate dehydrogenase